MGDALIGLGSSGLHTNGYSLARTICFQRLRLKPTSYVPELRNTLGEELLKIHVSYGRVIQALLARFNASEAGAPPAIRAFAHITGGGFVDNLPRVLPKRCDAVIRKGSWEVLPIFRFLAGKGARVRSRAVSGVQHGHWLCGHRGPAAAAAIRQAIQAAGHRVWPIGRVVRGRGRVHFE